MNKVWKYSITGILCAGGLYTGILNHVEHQVTTANQEKTAYLKKIQERNDLIKDLNGSNQKLYHLELTYNQVANETNQKNTQIATLKSDITQIDNQIKTISSSIHSAHTSASTPAYNPLTSSTGSSSTSSAASNTTTQAPPSIVVSPTPPVVQSTTKASGS